jgi:selT/selW/selH-like putative selenoprotein
LADALNRRFALESSLVKGSSGVFEVEMDGELIFSKRATGRFPAPGEVEQVVAARLAAAGPAPT